MATKTALSLLVRVCVYSLSLSTYIYRFKRARASVLSDAVTRRARRMSRIIRVDPSLCQGTLQTMCVGSVATVLEGRFLHRELFLLQLFFSVLELPCRRVNQGRWI